MISLQIAGKGLVMAGWAPTLSETAFSNLPDHKTPALLHSLDVSSDVIQIVFTI